MNRGYRNTANDGSKCDRVENARRMIKIEAMLGPVLDGVVARERNALALRKYRGDNTSDCVLYAKVRLWTQTAEIHSSLLTQLLWNRRMAAKLPPW